MGINARRLFITIVVAGCAICAGCGGNSHSGRPAIDTHSTVAIVRVPRNAAADARSFQQDEDDDDGPGEEKGSDSKDSDIDGDNDHLKPLGYYDRDDGAMRSFGHLAGTADRRALVAFAKRYYAAASTGDGATACSMFTAEFAKSVPEDYGHGSAGPSFLRQATTCPAVLGLVFAHLHAQLSVPIEVMQVRVKRGEGRVLIGGTRTRAGFLEVRRQGGGWRSVEMLPTPLP